jgi:hypothetical protein
VSGVATIADDDLAEYVMAVIAEEIGLSRRAMTLESTIEGDFGCTGDDARKLMERMQREFVIDMTSFEFNRHFDGARSAGWPFAVAAVVAAPLSMVMMPLIGVVARSIGATITNHLSAGWFFASVYFSCFVLTGLATALLPSERTRRALKLPVTVQDLVDAARTRTWSISGSQGAHHG